MRTKPGDADVGIRRYRPGDVQPLFEAVSESIVDLSAWMSWCHPDYSIKDSSNFVNSRDADWEKGEHYSFVIQDQTEERFLGSVGINFVNRVHNFANLGYWIRSSCAGRGLATAAVRLAARFGLEELKLQRLEIVTAVGNLASQRVAEKAGAVREGVLRNRLLMQGKPQNAVMHSLTVENLKP
jgi:ribosomal-protein-serine acetyltransferase